jgi:hypothetical protein
VKNHKIATNSTATKAREKNKRRFGILRILENLLIGIIFVMAIFSVDLVRAALYRF